MSKLYIPIGNIKHGEEIPGKVGRYCEVHQTIHGRFYRCHKYSEKIKEEIKKEERRHLNISSSIAIVIIFVILLTIEVLKYKPPL